MLKQRGIKATFYCVGAMRRRVSGDRQAHRRGRARDRQPLLEPSESHPDERVRGARSTRAHTPGHQAGHGRRAEDLRPPYGNFTQRQRNWANATYGYKIILWDVDTLDWQHHNPAKTESIALAQTRAGSIVLQHDIHKTTVDAMPATLDGSLRRGSSL